MRKKVGRFIILKDQQRAVEYFCKIYQAVDSRTGEQVIAEIYAKDTFGTQPTTKQTFLSEISKLRKMESSQLVKCIEYLETQNNIYVFKQLTADLSLKQHIQKIGRLEKYRALDFMFQLASGLSYLNQNGLILKNIRSVYLLIDDNKLKINRLSAQLFHKSMTEQRMMKFCMPKLPYYMAPQIWYSQNYTYKCDVWSFGVICYEMVMGCLPWKDPISAKLCQQIKQLTENEIEFPQDIEIPSKIKKIIRGCLRYNQQDRYTWWEIIDLLQPPKYTEQTRTSQLSQDNYSQLQLYEDS